MDDRTLRLDEPEARQLVLARAIEEVDTQGRLVSPIEREQLELAALAASRPAGDLNRGDYLRQRARRLLAAVENRDPAAAALQHPESWRRWAPWALAVAAALVGAALDRIDNPQRVNMLSPPLLGVLAWNLATYVLLAVGALLPARWRGQGALTLLLRWLTGQPALPGRRSGRLRVDVAARFHQHWLRATGRQQMYWIKQLLHLGAAGWALGLVLSILMGGLVREYRVGWESTLLDVGQVHAFLAVLFAPVVALLPFDPFAVADLQRMAFSSGAAVPLAEARRWVWMYVALLLLAVVLPRLLLAAWAAWRRHRLGRTVVFDLGEPYFVEVLARVSPAQVTLGIAGAAARTRGLLARALRPSADGWEPGGPLRIVLTSARGDTLRTIDIPAGFQPPSPLPPAPAEPGPGLREWLRRFERRRPPPMREDPQQAALADIDLLLLAPRTLAELEGATALLHWLAQPVLVLVDTRSADADLAGFRAELQRLRLAADAFDVDAVAGNWLREPVLLEAMAARLPPSQQAGWRRLTAAWDERNARVFDQAMRLLAGLLARAAADSEELGSGPVGLRQLVSTGERQAAQKAREAAAHALLQRLRGEEGTALVGLLRLYGGGVPSAPLPAARMEQDFVLQQAVDAPQAGMAGLASGAAMGAGIDLMTGGLTLGAAAALGAVIGGGAAFFAAAFRNRNAPAGPSQVQLSDDMLQTLTENGLLAYLAVAQGSGGAAPAEWRSEAVAAVAARREQLVQLWARIRAGQDVAVPLAGELAGLARGLLNRL